MEDSYFEETGEPPEEEEGEEDEGEQYVARETYNAQQPGDLSFKKGEVLTIIETEYAFILYFCCSTCFVRTSQSFTALKLVYCIRKQVSLVCSESGWWTAVNAAGKEGAVPSNFLLPYTPPAGGAAAAAGAGARGAKARSAGEEDDEEYDDETDGGGGGASVASQSLASQVPESLTETAADTGDEDGEEPSESATAPLGESLMHRTYAVELKLHFV